MLAALIAVFLMLSGVFVAISYVKFKDYTIDDCVNCAYGLNSLTMDSLDPEQIDAYMEQGHAHPDYDAIEERLYMLRDAFPNVTFLYVYQIREDGCHVVFDLDTEEMPASKPGEVVAFDKSFEKYIPTLLEGGEVPPIISRDTYGFLLTVYTPLRDRDGVCRCYVAVDYSMDLLNRYIRTIIGQIIMFFLIVGAIIIGVILLLTDKRIIEPMKRLEQNAYRDTLTGLRNSTAYSEYVRTLDAGIQAGSADFAILMADINNLKQVNDTCGHEKGNEYLKNAATLLCSVFGHENVFRVGGDEFAVVLEGEERYGAEVLRRWFSDAVERRRSDENLPPWRRISAAIGLAVYEPGRDTCAEDVLKRADAGMYENKQAMKAVRQD